VVEVVTANVPPIVTPPVVAVIEIPVFPVAAMFAAVVAVVELIVTSPVVVDAVSELETETVPP
jgi:hypothetical protein